MATKKKIDINNLPTINRFVLVAEPKNAFLEWARKFPDEDPKLTLDELLRDTSAYLIPLVGETPDSWLAGNFGAIFEIELSDWTVDPKCWPKDRSFNSFKEFFNVRFCSIAIDMGDGPIKRIYI